jgi:excisionase family DNA binding protein
MPGFDLRVLLRTTDAAAILADSPQEIARLIKAGRLEARRLPNGQVRIPMEAVHEFARSLPVVSPPGVPTC